MDPAVALVQAYLRVNGFLTVSEYPIIHGRQDGLFQEVTDIDIIAARFEQAGRVLPRPHLDRGGKMANDPALDLHWGRRELIIAEVKEGVAALNPAMFRRDVLHEAIRRFGICSREDLREVVRSLGDDGEATLEDGTRIRLVVFATRTIERDVTPPFLYLPIAAVVDYLESYVEAHWEVQNAAPFRDPVLRMLAVLAKASDRGANE